jgi:hypothetical protein
MEVLVGIQRFFYEENHSRQGGGSEKAKQVGALKIEGLEIGKMRRSTKGGNEEQRGFLILANLPLVFHFFLFSSLTLLV